MIFNFRGGFFSCVREQGFSLVELLIALAIVGIISTVAIPSYREHATRGKLPEAATNLAAKRIQMEQWFQDNRSYVDAPACNLDNTSSQYFDFSCTAVAATSFTLQAVGKSSMAGFAFTIDEANRKQTTAVPADWTLPTTNCWVTKREGC